MGRIGAGRILSQRKIPMTPSGIEIATFWLVAQFINQLRYNVQGVQLKSGPLTKP
jgi:hypothetical protein